MEPERAKTVPFKKARIAIPTVIVLLAVGAGGAQLWAEHEARTQVDAALAALPAGATGHYDHVGYNLFTRTLRLSGLTIARDGQPQFSVERAVLHHLSGNGGADSPLHASTVNLVNIDIWRGKRHVKIGDMTSKDVAILAPGVPAPAGTPRWLIAPENGTPVAIGSLRANTISDDQGMSIVALSLGGYQAGQVRDLSLTHYADHQGNTIENAAATAIDLDGLDRVFNPARYTPDAPGWTAPRPLLGHFEVAGVVTHDPTSDVHIDHLTLDGFAARPFAEAPTPAMTKSPAFLRDALQAIAIGNATALNIQATDSSSHGAFTLGHMSLTGYQDGALGRFTLGSVSVNDGGKAADSIGHLEIGGLNATPLLHLPPDAPIDTIVETAQSGGLKLTSFALSDVSIQNPDASDMRVTLKSLKETVVYNKPVQVTFALDDLGIPAGITPELGQFLQPLGVDPLVVSLKESGSYDLDSGDTKIDGATFTAQGLGHLDLSGEFTNLPRGMPKDNDIEAAIGQMGFGAFSMTFTNETLVQKLITHFAQQSGKSEADITTQARMAAAFAAAAIVPGQADAGDQISAFIANPKSLTITASPVAPVPLSEFLGGDIHAAQAALNLHLTAN